jgi:hypothetical protein
VALRTSSGVMKPNHGADIGRSPGGVGRQTPCAGGWVNRMGRCGRRWRAAGSGSRQRGSRRRRRRSWLCRRGAGPATPRTRRPGRLARTAHRSPGPCGRPPPPPPGPTCRAARGHGTGRAHSGPRRRPRHRRRPPGRTPYIPTTRCWPASCKRTYAGATPTPATPRCWPPNAVSAPAFAANDSAAGAAPCGQQRDDQPGERRW